MALAPPGWRHRRIRALGQGGARLLRVLALLACVVQVTEPPVMLAGETRCNGTAYATLFTEHGTNASTSLARNKYEERHSHQLQLIRVLLRSLRVHEDCRRHFVLLLGSHVNLRPSLQDQLDAMRREDVAGFVVHRIAPLVRGVPTADRLHAWQLTQYSRVLFMDADMLVLRPLDPLFAPNDATGAPANFTIAHHAYDLVQAQCNVPLLRRGVCAFYAFEPSMATYDALVTQVRSYSSYHLQHFSEQTALNCFFSRESVTLPCGHVYDVALPRHLAGGAAHAECVRWSAQSMRRACFVAPASRCENPGWSGRAACDEIAAHVRDNCGWPAGGAHAVHFKGSEKPWRHQCRAQAARGRLVTRLDAAPNAAPIPIERNPLLAEGIEWDGTACVARVSRSPVEWEYNGHPELRPSTRRPAVPRRCCTTSTLLVAEWYAMDSFEKWATDGL